MRRKAQDSPTFWRFLRFAFLAALAVACRAPSPVRVTDVSFAAGDGATISATLCEPRTTAPPAMLLLHMLGSDRRAWDRFSRSAASRGYMTLAIDLRGHGDTPSSSTSHSQSVASADVPVDSIIEHDIGPALQYLLDKGADPDNLFIVGASLGANLALRYAVNDPRVQAVVMLSPGDEYRGVTVMPEFEAFTKRPSLILATEGDHYSASTSRKLHAASEYYCELRLYPGSAHGTGILEMVESSTSQIFLWLDPIVKRPETVPF